jgi:hypothetical protein
MVYGFGLYSTGAGQVPIARSCEQGNESSDSIKPWDLLIS